jgi:hypothetical protein
MLIERALPQLLDPAAHAVTVLLTRIGQSQSNGLPCVMQVFALQPAWVDGGAHADDQGAVAKVVFGRGKGTFDDWLKFWRARKDVVLALRGLFVREALANEHGTWLLRSAAAEPDVVRVEIRPGAARAPEDVLRDHLAQRRELERVLEVGGALPANPDVLLPVTRTLTTRSALWWSARPFAVELEDFATGWVDRCTVSDIPSAVRRGWHLAWSRTS